MGKITRTVVAFFIVIAMSFPFAGCADKTNINAGYSQEQQIQHYDNSVEIESRINDILSTTPACEGWDPSIAEMVNIVFHDYQWSFKPYQYDDEVYVVEISGTYSPNPDLPNLSIQGTIRYFVNLVDGDVKIYTDTDGITSLFMVYIVG